jgi:hypothetical protein
MKGHLMMYKHLHFSLLLFVLCVSGFAQPLPDSLDKIKFIRKAIDYIRKEEKLKVSPDFYSRYQPGATMLTYLYVSSPDSIVSGMDSPFSFFGTNTQKALQEQKHYDSLGQHTLIYHTAGNSDAKINHRLLEYPKAAIAFILFHEAIHQHLKNSGISIPYEYEEALCDVNGNYGALLFAKKTKALKSKEEAKFIAMNERICRTIILINKGSRTVFRADRNKYQQHCDSALQKLLLTATVFHRDRFNYPVNNAFLLRNSFYGENYFLLKDVLDNNYDHQLKAFLDFAFTFPSRKDKVLNVLILKCVERIPP